MSPFDRILKIMLNPWVGVTFVGFVVLSFFYLDIPVAWFFYDLDLRAKLPVLYWLTKLGMGELYVAGLFLLALLYHYVRPNKIREARSWFLWLCIGIPYITCGVLKVCLGRARPQLLFSEQMYGFFGLHFQPEYWSFPSGHTTTITGLVFGLIILFPRYCYAFFFTGLLVISTRVLLTNHYLSDVLMTSYLTLVEVGLLLLVLRRKKWLASAYYQ